jgi:protein-tyrosine phosphatase
MGEALLRYRMNTRPLLAHVGVSSAGTIARAGQPPPAEAIVVMRDRFGLDITKHRARLFGNHLQADLILTVDRWTTDQADSVGASGPIEMLGDLVGTGEEVEDPYGGSIREYQHTIDQLDRLVDAAIARLETDAIARDAYR